jgi:hypothetical protein
MPSEAEPTAARMYPKELRDRVPSWAVDPFRRYLRFIDEQHQLVRLTRAALGKLSVSDKLVRALQNLEEPDNSTLERQQQFEDNIQLAELAKQEVARDFPMMNAHELISQWSALEVFSEDLTLEFLLNSPETLRAPDVRKVKITVGDLSSLDERELYRHVVRELQQQVKADLRRGSWRFDCLFDAIQLPSIGVPSAVERDIAEMWAVRNVLVHRGGVADRQFVQACPWLQANVNDRVTVDTQRARRLGNAASSYVVTVHHRVLTFFGVPTEVPVPTEAPASDGSS